MNEQEDFKSNSALFFGYSIQEIINLMYTKDGSAAPIVYGMHIHPALSEVVQRAFTTLMPPEEYRHVLEERYGIRI